jgi:hypothetical protein
MGMLPSREYSERERQRREILNTHLDMLREEPKSKEGPTPTPYEITTPANVHPYWNTVEIGTICRECIQFAKDHKVVMECKHNKNPDPHQNWRNAPHINRWTHDHL